MVIVLLPVYIVPVVMVRVAVLTLLFSVKLFDELVLFKVNILNVVAPVICASAAPVNCTVLVDAVKLPVLLKLPKRVWVKELASKVAPLETVIFPLTVIAPAAVLVPPLDTVRLL